MTCQRQEIQTSDDEENERQVEEYNIDEVKATMMSWHAAIALACTAIRGGAKPRPFAVASPRTW